MISPASLLGSRYVAERFTCDESIFADCAPATLAHETRPVAARCLGIIGGLGPVATANLYLDVCRLVHAEERVTPAILVDSVRMPRAIEEAFVAAVPGAKNESALLDIIRAAITRLRIAGADAICAACNTVQPLVLAEAQRSGVRAIGMIEVTIRTLRHAGHRSALVLGSASTRRLDLYGAAARAAGIALIYPSFDEQQEISRAILQLTHATATHAVSARIASVCARYEHGVDCVLLGCTDLSQIRDESFTNCPVVDSLSELGRAAAGFLRGER